MRMSLFAQKGCPQKRNLYTPKYRVFGFMFPFNMLFFSWGSDQADRYIFGGYMDDALGLLGAGLRKVSTQSRVSEV